MLILTGTNPLKGAAYMSRESRTFRDQSAAEYRASRRNSVFGTVTRELLRARAKAYKTLATNEEWLSGEMDRITGARTIRRQAPNQK
jgi:hypothetical protein